ncbi:MAG: hypothetical protein MJ151_03050 [Lachnospiraceae bacterium]|nr:hypothetical protein [Lachnospiraceae bacterium]
MIQLIVICCLALPVQAGIFSDYNDYINEIYEGGEPDYADGDLEDKLGDSGYYGDLFPEEVEGDNDYDISSNGGYAHKSFDRQVIVDRSDVSKSFSYSSGSPTFVFTQPRYGAVTIGDNIYYKNPDGTYKTGWYQESGKWYYFDSNSCALVRNQLVEFNGKVYYLQEDYTMATSRLININGVLIKIDENGCCEIINGGK